MGNYSISKSREKSVSFVVNGMTIRGSLHLPGKTLKRAYPGMVLLHGFMGNKIGLHRFYVKAARYFCNAGFVVLRFDFSGCGESDGEHEDITINGQIAEALAAIKFLKNHPEVDSSRIILTGLSMGGAVAALTATEEQNLAGTVLWAPVANMYNDILGVAGPKYFNEVWEKGISDFNGFPLGLGFLESLKKHDPIKAASQYKGPMLVVHGSNDKDVPNTNMNLYNEARKGISYHTQINLFDNADHTFTGSQWEKDLFNLTWHWIRNNTSIRQVLTSVS